MTTLLVAMLAVNAILHAAIVFRFGVKGNEPPLVFGVVYAALTIAVALGVAYALWATLIITAIGLAALTVAFGRIPHEKTFERLIMALNAALILVVGYLLFLR